MPNASFRRRGTRLGARRRRHRGSFLLPACLCAALALISFSSRAQWITDLEAGAFGDSNLGDATAGPDVHSVTGITEFIATGPFFELRPGTNLTLKAEVRDTTFDRFTAQDSLAAGLRARLDTKFGLGRQAPRAYLVVSDTHLSFRDDLRNGWLQTFTVGTRSMFGERLALHADWGTDRRTGSNAPPVRPDLASDVFDQSARRITVGGDYTLSDTLLFQLDTTLRRGDADYIETTNIFDSFTGASAVARDPGFGPSVFVEKIQVRSLLVDARLSWALGEHASLNLSFRRQLTLDTTGTLYTRSVPALTYQYRFD